MVVADRTLPSTDKERDVLVIHAARYVYLLYIELY